MFIKNLKIALRSLRKNKIYALISILGLSVGISGSTLIALYINDEMSYDLHHEKADRIYRVNTILDFNGPMNIGVTNLALGPTLKNDYPEVENYCRFFGGQQQVELTVNDQIFKESNLWFTDSSLFDVFSYQLIEGTSSALNAPNSIVLSRDIAMKLFNRIEVIGKQVKLNNTIINVTGVIENIPSNSEIKANAFISLNTLPQGFHDAHNQDWFRVSLFTYVLFNEPIKPQSFKSKLDELEEKYVQPWAELNGVEASHDYSLISLRELHFDNEHDFDLPKGDLSRIYIFAALALFLLLIAAINFINLSMAQHNKRAKEVGVRKTLGSSRNALIRQFLSESLLISAIAMVIGLALTELFISQFNILSGKEVSSIDIFSPQILLTELGVLVLIGLIAGLYPSIVLSSFNPIKVLKGGFSDGYKVGIFRKGLILLQFLFSLFMITGTLLIANQMDYLRTMNLGFDRENLVTVNVPADTAIQRRLNPWIEELAQESNIKNFSRTALPSGNTGELMFRIEQEGAMLEKTVRFLFVDEQFIKVLGLELLDGRNFSKDRATDAQAAFIINKTAAAAFGWNDEALNKRVQWGLLANGQAQNDGVVVGVVNDFNFLSLHKSIEPLVLCFNPNGGRNISIRFNKGDYTTTLTRLENKWNNIAPSYPFSYSFYDQDLDQNYQEEQKMFKVFTYFSGLSIVIACLGLFALLSFTIESRKKEIGIRKVLGASLPNLSWIILKDFAFLLIIAFLIASPINYYFIQKWQSNFAYQAPFDVFSYLWSILITSGLCALAVAYHSMKLNKTDPVNALREE